jgi:tRNA dimethylallyltransferase
MDLPSALARPTAILIAGPTASGKSALALALAERHGGVVVNADSMQVYRELRVLTARPSSEEEARAPHRLYGHVSGSEPYSAGRFVREVALVLEDARRAGRLPIVVGGSGLYFKALLEGLSPIPEIADDVRAHWRAEAARIGPAALHAELARRDPLSAASLRPTDPQRVTRALEVIEATGRPLLEWQRLPGNPVVDGASALKLLVAPEREPHLARADARFRVMVDGGALDEVRALRTLGLSAELPVMRALGVRPLSLHLDGALTLDAAIAAGQRETRQYAKRQRTWTAQHMIAWNSINTQQMERLAANGFTFSDP